MKTMRAIISILFVLMLFFAGCASPPANEKTTATTEMQDETVTTQAGTVSTTEKTVETTVPTSEDSGAAEGLFGLLEGAVTDYTVSYNVKSVSNLPNGLDTTTQDMTYYIKGEDKIRVDTLHSYQGGVEEVRIYVLNKDYIMCSKDKGTWGCTNFSRPSTQDDSSLKPNADDLDNVKASKVTQLADRVIAGINTKCYKSVLDVMNSDAATAEEMRDNGLKTRESTYCVSADGVVLYSEVKDELSVSTSQATSYKRGTADSDYVLPAAPTDMSSLMAQAQAQMGAAQQEEE